MRRRTGSSQLSFDNNENQHGERRCFQKRVGPPALRSCSRTSLRLQRLRRGRCFVTELHADRLDRASVKLRVHSRRLGTCIECLTTLQVCRLAPPENWAGSLKCQPRFHARPSRSQPSSRTRKAIVPSRVRFVILP